MKELKDYWQNTLCARLLTLMIVLLCFFYPISAISSLILGIDTSFFNVVYRALIAVIATYIIFVSIFKYNFSLLKTALPMLLFMLFYLFRIFYDTMIEGIETTHKFVEIYSFYLGNIFLPYFAIVSSSRCLNKKRLVSKSLLVLAVSNVFILVAYLNQLNWNISIEIFLYRAAINANETILNLINPITYGLYGGALFIFSLAHLVLFRETLTVEKKYFIYSFLALGLLNLILASSRGPLLYSFCSIIVLLYFYSVKSKKNSRYYLGNIFIIIVLFYTIIFTINYLDNNKIELGIVDRLLSTKDNIEKGYDDERDLLYREAFEMFLEKPVLGNQINLKSLTYPHNILLELLMSTGLIGAILYFFGFRFVLLKIIDFKKYDNYLMLYILLFIVYFGLSFTSGCLYQATEVWCFIALLLSWRKDQLELNIKTV